MDKKDYLVTQSRIRRRPYSRKIQKRTNVICSVEFLHSKTRAKKGTIGNVPKGSVPNGH